MSSIMKKFFIAASAAGMSAIAQAPSFAYTITGNNDVLLYDNNYGSCGATSTCLTNDMSRLDAILAGNSSAPGGNVELFASSEQLTKDQFLASNARTNIEGTVAGKSLTLSSLTATDWFGPTLNTAYGVNNFANTWFNAFYDASGLAANEGAIKAALQLPSFLPSSALRQLAYINFLDDQVKGFQRSSDPNISYVTTSGSDLLIGLAGHFDAKAFYASQLGPFASFINNGFQVSEVVKVNYGGIERFLYSFNATRSGLVNNSGLGNDGLSHTGNYEVALRGVVPPSASVPEPSVVFGLIGLGGLLAAKRKQQQAG
ncbi:NF038130 family PEP-CTERM protein [Aerosakkonemataceae cyanobacterium BLCC-F50]|uniref:NF038130 family PEP-CTERM protein n=1 Tax=Floridaenema flaviceps BLCC-F50 TaxID=3153642 RepID=A0ABV4XR64_9CYAN